MREAGLYWVTKAAEELGVTKGAVSRWIGGTRPIPGTVIKLIERMETAK